MKLNVSAILGNSKLTSQTCLWGERNHLKEWRSTPLIKDCLNSVSWSWTKSLWKLFLQFIFWVESRLNSTSLFVSLEVRKRCAIQSILSIFNNVPQVCFALVYTVDERLVSVPPVRRPYLKSIYICSQVENDIRRDIKSLWICFLFLLSNSVEFNFQNQLLYTE